VIRVRESARGAAGVATAAWSVTMAVSIFAIRADTARASFELVAVLATFLLGAYLGWHRRTGVVLLAPVASWLFAWFPLLVAEMIRDGFLRGLFVGLFLDTIGWIAIGGAEFLALLAIALPFRVVAGLVHHDTVVTIENPFKFS
jgi:hypothetical protein